MLAVGAAISVGVPLAFVWIVQRLDLCASGGYRTGAACVAAGLASFAGAFVLNGAILDALVAGGLMSGTARALVVARAAPLVEEALKALALVPFVRRRRFSYFVDGAIYGFAVGTAFAVFENLLYLASAPPGLHAELAVYRAFSTSLMHGTTGALIGVGLGRARVGRGMTRALFAAVGLTAAVLLHAGFNHVVSGGPDTMGRLTRAIAIGIGGLALTAGLIVAGLLEERRFLRSAIARGAAGAATAAPRPLLAPIGAHFGAARQAQVEAFLHHQARVEQLTGALDGAAPDERRAVLTELSAARDHMDVLRRNIGFYCMSYVRSVLPGDTARLWQRLDEDAPSSGMGQTPGAV